MHYETMLVRYVTLCGCQKEESFDYDGDIPEFIDRLLYEPLRLVDYYTRDPVKAEDYTMKRRRFVFDEILRYGSCLIFVYREHQNG